MGETRNLTTEELRQELGPEAFGEWDLYRKVNQVEALSDMIACLDSIGSTATIGRGDSAVELSEKNTGYPWEAEILNDLRALRDKHKPRLEGRLRELVK